MLDFLYFSIQQVAGAAAIWAGFACQRRYDPGQDRILSDRWIGLPERLQQRMRRASRWLATDNRLQSAAWWCIGGCLCLGAIGKSLGVHNLVLSAVRDWAREGDWYRERREYQALVVVVVAVVGIGVAACVLKWTWQWSVSVRIALVGLVIHASVTLARLTSLHQIDAFFDHAAIGLGGPFIIEIIGSTIALVAAIVYLRLP